MHFSSFWVIHNASSYSSYSPLYPGCSTFSYHRPPGLRRRALAMPFAIGPRILAWLAAMLEMYPVIPVEKERNGRQALFIK